MPPLLRSPHSYQCARAWKRFGILFNARAKGNFLRWEDSFDRWKREAPKCQECQKEKIIEKIAAKNPSLHGRSKCQANLESLSGCHQAKPAKKIVKLGSKFRRVKLDTWVVDLD